MNKLSIFVGAVLPILAFSSHGAQVAQARLFCYSLKFQRGAEPFGLFSLDLTMLNSGVNGELAYAFAGSYTHDSYIFLNDEVTFGDPIPGQIGLDVPAGADLDDDGFADFFEVDKGVAASSTGAYSIAGYGAGAIKATWSRGAGSRFGSCILDFKVNAFQSLAVFTHTFELIEYAGPLTYTPASNIVSATLDLRQTGNESSHLKGPIQWAKVTAAPANQLDLLPGGWTNEALLTLTFPTNYFDRDLDRLTNYYGGVFFDDGDPNSGESDYWFWMLSIDDPNDADQDGIPDLSDDPVAVTPPRRPRLTLTSGETNLWLVISGDPGRVHRIQDATNLTLPAWQPVTSVALTNDPQLVSLPLPTGQARFWRVVVE